MTSEQLSVLAGTLSKFGAGLFLLVQVLILLDFTHSWNDAWVEKDEQKWLSSNIIFHYFHFAACILISNSIPGCTLGMLLYLLYQLDATLRHLHSLDFCSFGSTPLVTTAASMSSSL